MQCFNTGLLKVLKTELIFTKLVEGETETLLRYYIFFVSLSVCCFT